MIDFRYHVVSIVAVFLSLALGLFIGSTSLRGKVANDITSRTTSVFNENKKLSGQVAGLQDQFNHFESASEPYLVGNALSGESVIVVSAPGVDNGMRRRLLDELGKAGATVTGDVRIQDPLLDAQQEQFLGTLADRLALSDRPLPNGTGAERAIALLAQVLGTRPQGSSVSPAAAAKVLSAYADGNLVRVSGGTARSGALAVILTAPPKSDVDPKVAEAQQALLLSLADDLDRSAVGAVVAGPETAADAGGTLAAVRGDKELGSSLSTVDSADLPSGLIATILALAEQARGGAGSYGNGAGSRAALPTPAP